MIKQIKKKWFNLKSTIKYWIEYELINYSAIVFFLLAAIFFSVLIFYLDFKDPQFSWHDILVEAHGLIFDLLILGLLWTVFEFYKSKKEKIKALTDEINDLIQLKTEEARVGIISKMNSLYYLGVCKFYISGAFLKNGSLQEMDLTESIMVLINFENGSFIRSTLKNVDLRASNLKNVYFTDADLENAKLSRSNLSKSKFTITNFTNSDLTDCDLDEAEFAGCSYENANFSGVKLTNVLVDNKDWFGELKSQNVIGIDELEQLYTVSEKPIEKHEGLKFYIIKKRKKIPA